MSGLLYLLLAVYLAGVLLVYSMIFDEDEACLVGLITFTEWMLGTFLAIFWPVILLIGFIKGKKGGSK
jgi:hypothetical protein